MEQFFLAALDFLADSWPYLLVALTLALNLWACGHAVLHKRDTLSATAWAGLIWTAPLLGAGLYFLFGINRIRRRARSLRSRTPRLQIPATPICVNLRIGVFASWESRRVFARSLSSVAGPWLIPGAARWLPPTRGTESELHASDCVAAANAYPQGEKCSALSSRRSNNKATNSLP
jgi:hypothetical protein